MLNKDGVRELAYLVKVDDVTPMNADRLECAHVGGWRCVVGKGEFKKGDVAVYFEVDSKVPDVEPFSSMDFLRSKDFKVKTQKIRGEYSQGLLVSVEAFGWVPQVDGSGWVLEEDGHVFHHVDDESRFLTERLGVTYGVVEDNSRKAEGPDKYKNMAKRHPKAARTLFWRWLYKRNWGKKLLYLFFGGTKKSRKEDKKGWPVGKFPGVKKTDQERIECMEWVLNDKTPFIRTQKCDGSSATYILERKKRGKFEFYVCSRNVRLFNEEQETYHKDKNHYWEVANEYKIEEKMKDYLSKNPECWFVCWQGEICAPGIQGNPHGLTKTHFYCFHMTDSNGRYDIRDAKKIWDEYDMETVPIEPVDYILPDDFEEFKESADGFYDPSVCEGKKTQKREGYVYYKTTDPTFSFKNVSRSYLVKRGE